MLWTLDTVGYCALYSLVGGCVGMCVPKIFFFVLKEPLLWAHHKVYFEILVG